MTLRKPLFMNPVEGFSEEMAATDSLQLGGLTMTGPIAMGGYAITGMQSARWCDESLCRCRGCGLSFRSSGGSGFSQQRSRVVRIADGRRLHTFEQRPGSSDQSDDWDSEWDLGSSCRSVDSAARLPYGRFGSRGLHACPERFQLQGHGLGLYESRGV